MDPVVGCFGLRSFSEGGLLVTDLTVPDRKSGLRFASCQLTVNGSRQEIGLSFGSYQSPRVHCTQRIEVQQKPITYPAAGYWLILIKWQACKPGSVSRVFRNFYHLSCFVIADEIQAAYPLRPRFLSMQSGSLCFCAGVYMALHPMKRTAGDVAIATGGLLPRLFTLAHRNLSEEKLAQLQAETPASGFFLLRGYPLTEIFPLGSMVPYGARTFLPPQENEER
jgi:hypothetical protein